MSQEEIVLSNLETAVSCFKTISEEDPVFGKILLTFVGQSMDLYEAIARDREFSIRPIVGFVGQMLEVSEGDLIRAAYDNAQKSCDESIVDSIVSHVNTEDVKIDEYRAQAAKLIQEFKTEVNRVVGQ